MKNSIIIFILCAILGSCESSVNKEAEANEEKEELTIEGNWELVSFYNYQDNQVVDSFKTNEGYRQVKMYQNDKVMWSKLVPLDSTEWFGYGNYTASNDTLIEVLEYGSKIMNQVIAEKKQFVHKLILEKNKFIQIELDEDGNYVYSENYRRIAN